MSTATVTRATALHHDPALHHDTADAPLRLTRRGRLLLLVALVAVLFGAFSLGRTATQAAPTAGTAQVTQPVETTVQPGESLWSVASRIAPDNDPREVVAQIRRLNGLTSSQLQPGQQLLLPRAA